MSAATQNAALIGNLTITFTVTKLKCIWNKYTNYERMKESGSYGILKTMYHNVSFSFHSYLEGEKF